jgi:hypothetical protein
MFITDITLGAYNCGAPRNTPSPPDTHTHFSLFLVRYLDVCKRRLYIRTDNCSRRQICSKVVIAPHSETVYSTISLRYFPCRVLSLSLPAPLALLPTTLSHSHCLNRPLTLDARCKLQEFLLLFPSQLKTLPTSAYLSISFRDSLVFVCQTQQLIVKFRCYFCL